MFSKVLGYRVGVDGFEGTGVQGRGRWFRRYWRRGK